LRYKARLGSREFGAVDRGEFCETTGFCCKRLEARTQMWTFIQDSITVAAIVATVNGFFIWIVKRYIDSRFNMALENYRFELKTREQAAKIAEYASRAIFLKSTDNDEAYQRANQLSWELFLLLPTDVYRKLGRGLHEKQNVEELSAISD
jgi:hypothetical protein